jgi:biopolymer transport protein ExbD
MRERPRTRVGRDGLAIPPSHASATGVALLLLIVLVSLSLARAGGSARTAAVAEPLVVDVAADGGVSVDGERVALEDLAGRVAARREGRGVQIRSARGASVEALLRIAAALEKPGPGDLDVAEPGGRRAARD